jgi:hypothetical protein
LDRFGSPGVPFSTLSRQLGTRALPGRRPIDPERRFRRIGPEKGDVEREIDFDVDSECEIETM